MPTHALLPLALSTYLPTYLWPYA
eukprot:COSAG01_NODE_8759_length_2669_cov_46.491051_1_plen_23_part_10